MKRALVLLHRCEQKSQASWRPSFMRNQLAAALLADEISDDAAHFREKREEWIGKLQKERQEWTVRKQQEAEREVRRANERAQTAAFHAASSEIQRTREIEARVRREVETLSPKKSSVGKSSSHHLGTIAGSPSSSLPSLPDSAVNSHRGLCSK